MASQSTISEVIMNQKHSSAAVIAKGALSVFAVIVVSVNAFVTWQFGTYYLNRAFGIQNGMMAGIAGGAYAILFLDVASLVWLFAYMRLAETSAQRGIGLTASILAFIGSLLATIYMLSANTAGALSAYTESISTISQVAMIVIVVIHAVLLALYLLFGRDEMVTQATINATTNATGEALTRATNNVQNLVPQLAQDISAAIETHILSALSFTRQHDGRLVYMPTEKGDAPAQLSATTRPAPVRDTTSGAQRSKSLQQLMAMLANVSTTDGMYDLLDNYHRDINRLSPSDYELWHQAQQERHNLLAQYGRLDEFGADGGQQAGAEQARRLSRFHTVLSDEYGDVPISTDLTRAEFNAAIEAAERAKRDSANRPTNGRNGAR